MGDTHFRSNIKGQAGTETITEFATIGDTSAAIVGSSITTAGTVSAANVTISTQASLNRVKLGTHSYIYSSAYDTTASVLAEATALDAAIANSFVMGSGKMFYVEAAATCYAVNATALT